MWLSPKLAGRMIPDLPNVKPRWQGGLPTLYRDGVIQVIVRRLTARYRNRISEGTGFGPATVEHEAGAGGGGVPGGTRHAESGVGSTSDSSLAHTRFVPPSTPAET